MLTILGASILALSGWFLLRQQLLNKGWDKAVSKMEDKGYVLNVEKKQFSGWFEVEFRQLNLSVEQDTVAKIEKIQVAFNPWKILTEGIGLSSIKIEKAKISLFKDSQYCNYCRLVPSKNSKELKSSKPLFQRVFQMVRRLLNKAPSQVQMLESSIFYSNKKDTYSINIDKTFYNGDQLNTLLGISESGKFQQFEIKGNFDADHITGKLVIAPVGRTFTLLPLLQTRFNLQAGFKKLKLRLDELDVHGGALHFRAGAGFDQLMVKHKRISDTQVVVNKADGQFYIKWGADFAELDSSTFFNLNKIRSFWYAKYEYKSAKTYALKFKTQKIKAQDFFESLPTGMFSTLEGIKVTGDLAYTLNFALDDKKPFECIFDSRLISQNFKIIKMGKENLAKMSGEFMHEFYEGDRLVRRFMVGASNSSFVPLDQIPEHLQKAVLAGEDPAFFGHNGFLLESIRQSIAQNYIARRFVRGGSTISMQLVKNVFLSRKKTLARKIEEVLLVWIIENKRLTSKGRMFEAYLNLIEWGPGVFGIGEASSYYFGKPASELSAGESVFLAAIIPMPKSYRYFVDSSGSVSAKEPHFRAIMEAMLRHKTLSESDTMGGKLQVKLQPSLISQNSTLKKPDDVIEEKEKGIKKGKKE